MEKISEGPELDLAVAEAMGLVFTIQGADGKRFFSDPRDPLPGLRTFQPSTDLNDAIRAADELGVINHYCVLRRNRYRWEVYKIGDPLDEIISNEETPALAICAAILKTYGK